MQSKSPKTYDSRKIEEAVGRRSHLDYLDACSEGGFEPSEMMSDPYFVERGLAEEIALQRFKSRD